MFWGVDYDKYGALTPVEQLLSISNAKIIQHATCENKECVEIEFVDDADGITKNMWILSYKAIPWKVQWFDEAKGKQFTSLYHDIVLSVVKDSDIMIPPEYEFVEK